MVRAARARVIISIAFFGVGATAAFAQTHSLKIDGAAAHTRTEPLIIGVGLHFGHKGAAGYSSVAKSVEMLRDAGFGSFRDDLPWTAFYVPPTGEVGRQPALLFDFLTAAKARPVLILGQANPRVPGGNPPVTPVGRSEFVKFAQQAVLATQRWQPFYEIWNEWNIMRLPGYPRTATPGDDNDPRAAVNYAELAKEAIDGIRKVAPHSQVLVGAVGTDSGWQWTKAIVERGALNGAAGLSVHFYNQCERRATDRTAQQAIGQLTALQEALRSVNDGHDTPIYVTEFGWPTTKRHCSTSRETAADYVAQFLFWSAATPWIKGAWIYELKDQGTDPDNLEMNYGVYDLNDSPKPTACIVREAVQSVGEARDLKLLKPLDNVFVVTTSHANGIRLVSWTSDENPRAKLSLPAGRTAHVRRICADEEPAAGDVALTGRPVVIDVEGKAPFSLGIAVDR